MCLLEVIRACVWWNFEKAVQVALTDSVHGISTEDIAIRPFILRRKIMWLGGRSIKVREVLPNLLVMGYSVEVTLWRVVGLPWSVRKMAVVKVRQDVHHYADPDTTSGIKG